LSAYKVGFVALVLGLIGSVVVYFLPPWFPVAASVQADRQDALYMALMWMSSFIFFLVAVFLLYSVWKWRARPGDEDRDGKPIHGNTSLEIIWTIIPTIIVVAFAVAAGIVLVKNETVPHDRLVVRVNGQQFTWWFQYPGGKVSHELVLPIDKPTEFVIRSVEESCIDQGTNWKKCGDVIHSFYVPEFRVKADAVPGIINRTYAEPTRMGTYPLICTELCGLGHSEMRSIVHVVSQEEYDRWLAALPAPKPAQGA
jgi:cytochrome c oxidase subunit II